eukprot:5793160-Amphidinium_carterae.1
MEALMTPRTNASVTDFRAVGFGASMAHIMQLQALVLPGIGTAVSLSCTCQQHLNCLLRECVFPKLWQGTANSLNSWRSRADLSASSSRPAAQKSKKNATSFNMALVCSMYFHERVDTVQTHIEAALLFESCKRNSWKGSKSDV